MLLPGAEMQISFLKDLVSLRNPSGTFSFLNYLKEKDRFSEFANLRNFFPSRAEYSDYLRGAADKVVLLQ
ncbi:L-ornithine N5-oxygenase [Robbsia andropogonis]